jgi:UDP-N-acetylglucosamine--N-acetylmuramyl-(pentapeptide) pyrophosphoryl-undecaprenol N-acetylglucosamine transferase
MKEGAGLVMAMAGGGTGGHVVPALAVANELASRGHSVFFVGTRGGFEAKLVPEAGFAIEWIEAGALNRAGTGRALRTLVQLPGSVLHCMRLLGRQRVSAVFSMGGYVAAPTVLAALLVRIPVVIMEPNAIPGAANRWIGRFVAHALLSFEDAARFFPKGRSEITGLPVRARFFDLPARPRSEEFHVLVTGGSRGARSLNRAVCESWPILARSGRRLRLTHQTGVESQASVAEDFARTGLPGKVVAFLDDMPAAFAEADLVVCRSGAGALAELAAAGKPSLLVPFPFAADDHQRHNAEALARAGAARVVLDRELSGERLAREILALENNRDELARMGDRARSFSRPGAAQRAADVIEQLARRRG